MAPDVHEPLTCAHVPLQINLNAKGPDRSPQVIKCDAGDQREGPLMRPFLRRGQG